MFGFRKIRQIKHHACGFSSRTLITTVCHLRICIESIFYIQSTNCTLPHVETIMFLPVVTLRCLISLRFQLLWLLYLALYLYESSVMILKCFFFFFEKSQTIFHIFFLMLVSWCLLGGVTHHPLCSQLLRLDTFSWSCFQFENLIYSELKLAWHVQLGQRWARTWFAVGPGSPPLSGLGSGSWTLSGWPHYALHDFVCSIISTDLRVLHRRSPCLHAASCINRWENL